MQGKYGAQLTSLSALQSALTSAVLQAQPLTLEAAQRVCATPTCHLPTLMLSYVEVTSCAAVTISH